MNQTLVAIGMIVYVGYMVAALISIVNPAWSMRWFHRRDMSMWYSCRCGTPVTDFDEIRDALSGELHHCEHHQVGA